MMLDRRTFLGTALVATGAAAIANFLSLSSTVEAYALLTSPSRNEEIAETAKDCLAFKIDGWDHFDDFAMDRAKRAPVDLATSDPAGDHMLIKMNQSWRTTWR